MVSAEIFLPVLFEMKITSVNEYFKLRYKSEVAMNIASITTLVTLIPNLALNLYYPGLALAIVTNMSEESSVILCGLLCTAYTSFGGLKAVIWTDFVQYSVIMGSLILICIKGSVDVGSMVEVFHRADLGE
jgi:Na+/proline symporter